MLCLQLARISQCKNERVNAELPEDRSGWVQVPQNPYAQQRPKGGKAFAAAAMGLGLAALLTAVVGAIYSVALAWVALALAIAAVICGVFAKQRKQQPRGAWVVGFTTGGLAALGSLVVVALASSSVFAPAVGEPTGMTDEITAEWTPETEQPVLIVWPRNMSSGGVLFAGPGSPVARESDALGASEAPVANPTERDRITDVLIYVDYQCPHCRTFEQTNGAFLEQLIADGSATVEVVALSFLDRSTGGDRVSARTAAALACVADAQPASAWAAHRALLTPGFAGNTAAVTNEVIVSSLQQADVTLTPQVTDCITTERFVGFAQALNSWVFANPVPGAVNQDARLSGTPSVFVNGVFYEGKSDDAQAFAAFYAEHATPAQ